MGYRSLLILTALRFEADGIARGLGLQFQTPVTASNGENLSLQVVGPRAAHLPAKPPAGCEGVILAGLSGGLSPDLKRGEVVNDERSTLDLLRSYPSRETCALRHVKFVTADRIVTTPADKAALYRETGGAVVDMETDIVRAWAERQGLPFAAIRAISDTANETLDPAVLRFVDSAGFTRPMAVVKELIKRPTFLPAILRLRHSGPIIDALARELHSLLMA